jgi:hypothetical protein
MDLAQYNVALLLSSLMSSLVTFLPNQDEIVGPQYVDVVPGSRLTWYDTYRGASIKYNPDHPPYGVLPYGLGQGL